MAPKRWILFNIEHSYSSSRMNLVLWELNSVLTFTAQTYETKKSQLSKIIKSILHCKQVSAAVVKIRMFTPKNSNMFSSDSTDHHVLLGAFWLTRNSAWYTSFKLNVIHWIKVLWKYFVKLMEDFVKCKCWLVKTLPDMLNMEKGK